MEIGHSIIETTATDTADVVLATMRKRPWGRVRGLKLSGAPLLSEACRTASARRSTRLRGGRVLGATAATRAVPARAAAGAVQVVDVVGDADAARAAAAGVAIRGHVNARTKIAQARAATGAGCVVLAVIVVRGRVAAAVRGLAAAVRGLVASAVAVGVLAFTASRVLCAASCSASN